MVANRLTAPPRPRIRAADLSGAPFFPLTGCLLSKIFDRGGAARLKTTGKAGVTAMRKWIGWGIVGVIVLAAIAGGGEEATREPANKPANEGTVTRTKKPSAPPKVPKLKGERLDVAEDLLDEKGLKYKEVGGGSFGVVDTSAWEVCETRPKAGKRTKATVKLVVDRPGECGKKESVADSGGGGGGGGDDLGGLFEGDVKAKEVRSIPIGTSKRTVRSKLGSQQTTRSSSRRETPPPVSTMNAGTTTMRTSVAGSSASPVAS